MTAKITSRNPVEKPVPYDREAERSVLASVMVDPDAMDRIDALVSASDFFGAGHAEVFVACRELWRNAKEINQITVSHRLGSDPKILAELSEMIGDLPTPIGVEYYAEIVHKQAMFRRIIQVGQNIVAAGYDGGPDFNALLAKTEGWLGALHDDELVGSVQFDKLFDEYWETDGISSRSTRFVRSGLMELDNIVHGFKPKTLTIIGAQTGIGKSVLLLNIARSALLNQNFRVAVMSLEMGREEWRDRMAAHMTGIAIDRLALGISALSELETAALMDARGQIDGLPLYVDDSTHVSVDSLRAKARALRSRIGGLDLLIVDYLQLMGNTQRFDRRELEVGAISRALKVLSKELDVPIIVAAQLSREVEKRSTTRTKTSVGSNGKGGIRTLTIPGRPRLSDLRESGSIEQDADVVVFLYRRDKAITQKEWENFYVNEPNAPRYPAGLVELIVAKQRNGRTGTCTARMVDQYARIEDLQPLNEPQEAAPWAR